ncbi:delta-1-pyrroline-5-carboxylate dehydrogenase, mitochondrial-like [Oscarella lobularis]|uniref:delta-1-pyrroline-5-carboxylate dehydrogenase, mitochondrial-like n=1 Tax=Oscarella lobularis TaxID=121494 RepID=UPI0033143CE9
MLRLTRASFWKLESSFPTLYRLASSSFVSSPVPTNESMLDFQPGSPETAKIKETLTEMKRAGPVQIPCVINGEEIQTGETRNQVAPYDHQRVVSTFNLANGELIKQGIERSLKIRRDWEMSPFEDKAAVFLKAAELLSEKYRYEILAATMIGQGKTIFQAEIDASCELIDFYRFGVKWAEELHYTQPKLHSTGIWNKLVYRGLEGFVASISPFNFTAIGGNLCAMPALMGNVVQWKPSDTAMLSNYMIFKILREAGLPDGVINFLPADGPTFGDTVTSSPDLAAIVFTGSAKTFKHLWKQVGHNIDTYKSFPRFVGESGGKNYHFVHPTADLETAISGTVRSAYEFSGQKCSACSRLYVPDTLWPQIKEGILDKISKMKINTPEDFSTYTSAVIDDKSFGRLKKWIDLAKNDPELKIIVGGNYDDSVGYYIYPTVIETTNPKHAFMQEEMFGPVLTVYVYPAGQVEQTLRLIDETSPYALTGSIYARERTVLRWARDILRDSAGNIYFNDKSTGSVVGQQPFGGSRASGTNDKTNMAPLLYKFTSIQSVKDQLAPQTEWKPISVED